MARAVRLDFVSARPPSAVLGILLLAAGLGGAAWMGMGYRGVAAETEALESRIADLRRMGRREMPPIRTTAVDPKVLGQEIRQANAVLAQLNLPWDALFRELESASVEGITLLAIQPEVGASQVRISGEARTYETALAYVAKLEESERFANVLLTAHEVRTNAPQRPVVFSLVAEWSAQ